MARRAQYDFNIRPVEDRGIGEDVTLEEQLFICGAAGCPDHAAILALGQKGISHD
jgi:hypothetical protein